jgi:alpha-ketoglutarate-dependent taurine dioxygenase
MYPSLATRLPFDASIDVDSQVVEIPSVRQMSRVQQCAMLDRFDRYGFMVLRCRDLDDSRQDLLHLGRYFGNWTPHPRVESDGVVPISNAEYRQGFLGSTAEEHPLHTDGAFRDNPEKIVTLQAVSPAPGGGDSVLASGLAGYEHLVAKFTPKELWLLSKEDALTISRGTQSSTQAIFPFNDDGNFWIKFRMEDGVTDVAPHPDVSEAFEELRYFYSTPGNYVTFRLEAGDILIGDNTAIVHGRTSFPHTEKRDMRRMNFDGSGAACARLVFGFRPRMAKSIVGAA